MGERCADKLLPKRNALKKATNAEQRHRSSQLAHRNCDFKRLLVPARTSPS